MSVTFTPAETGKAADTVTRPNVWLYVPEGKPPTPFVPGGKFNAVWNGLVTVEKRANYQFQAELNGALKVEINGQTVLWAETNGLTELSQPAQLNKGTNALRVLFTSPGKGDAFVRLRWLPKESFLQPIPIEALTLAPETAEAKQAARLHQGRELFTEFRCAKCHAVPGETIPELGMDAPEFAGIGSRRNYEWMARWIQDPKALRATARMPKVLHGPEAKAEAEAIAAFLASLKSEAKAGADPAGEQSGEGKAWFEKLHCAACHNDPGAAEADAGKIVLKAVREKFAPGELAAFLRKPDAHYAWIRMPNFHLNETEAAQLAAYLIASADQPKSATAPTDASVLERGKKLVQTSGCLSCHSLNSLKLENQFAGKPLKELTAEKWTQGCLAATPDGKAPQFAFTSEEREALQAFGATDRSALTRHVPVEFAQRQTRLLNCRECHGKFEGFPAFDLLGGKLKPEWSQGFIAGANTNKPRSWLEARMPGFGGKRAESIAPGLAMLHGYPPQTPAEPAIDMEKAKVGQKLVSMAGGFSCVTCHSIGNFAATQVFESAGINLALTGSRLMKPYMMRWVRNPQAVDPTTKMPLYFDDEGKSPLGDIYGGDSAQQIEAIWEYIRLGDKMPAPPMP